MRHSNFFETIMISRGKIKDEVTADRYQKLFAMLLDAIPSSVLLVNQDLRIVLANRNFLEKSRRSESDTIGSRLEEVIPVIIFEHMDISSRIRQVFLRNQPTRGEKMTYRAPGLPMRIYYYSILPFSWNGIVENALLLMDDVTEQIRLSEEIRRVERHLASVVESASDIVLSSDMEGRILTWNTAAEKLSGYSLYDVKEKFFVNYIVSLHQEEVTRIFSSMKMTKSSQQAEWDLITKQGNLVPVSWVCSPMIDDKSQIVGIVAVGRDQTERRRFEIQLLRSQKLAALGVMAGGIAHEIRNPLAIAFSAVQFLQEEKSLPEFKKECVQKIQTGIQRASSIIENLLKFARPSLETNLEDISLLSLLNEAWTLVANQARIQKIEFRSNFPKESLWIKGISNSLQQVFINLFLNAINAMPDGGNLEVEVERINNEVGVRVIDTGYGISEEEISKIFDPFYSDSPAGKGTGTGLGLSICYSIVKQHFGTIEVDSIPGKGSTFTVRLPIL